MTIDVPNPEPNGNGHDFALDDISLLGPDQTDLIASSLAWNDAQAGVDFGYEVAGADLTDDTTAALYWATDTTFASRIGGPVYSTTIERPVGQYGPFYVPNSVLGTPPANATHLLLAVDPPNTGNGVIEETNESNNVRSIPLPLPDIQMLSARLVSPTQAQFEYATAGYPGPFAVALYRSADQVFDGTDEFLPVVGLGGNPYETVIPGFIGDGTTISLTLLDPYETDPLRPYLLAVADPTDAVMETEDYANNFSEVVFVDLTTQIDDAKLHKLLYGGQVHQTPLLVRNDGTEIAQGNLVVEVYLSKNRDLTSTAGDELLASQGFVIDLAPGQTTPFDVQAPIPPTITGSLGGMWFLKVIVPADQNTVLEIDKNNNTVSGDIPLQVVSSNPTKVTGTNNHFVGVQAPFRLLEWLSRAG